MKKYLSIFLFLGIAVAVSLAFTKLDKSIPSEFTKSKAMQETDSLLRHVVLFKFKDSTSAEKLKEIEDSFSNLPSKIKEIQDYEWGLNNSPEGLNKGLTHCFFVTFRSEEGRGIYLPHPAHQAFVALASPYIEDVTVVDYWAK